MFKYNYEEKNLKDLKNVFHNKNLYSSWFIDEVSLSVEANSSKTKLAYYSDIVYRKATLLYHSKCWVKWYHYHNNNELEYIKHFPQVVQRYNAKSK